MYTKINVSYFLCPLLISLTLLGASISHAEESSSNDTTSTSSTDTGASSVDSSTVLPASSTNQEFATQESAAQDIVDITTIDTEKGASPAKLDALYEYGASIGTGFEFNDNIYDDVNNRVAAFMTHIRPSFSFQRLGGRIVADIQYSGEYTFYLGEKADPEYQHTINASATAEIVKNVFFLKVSENMQQVYENVTKGEFEAGDSEDDTRNRNTIIINPYFTFQPSKRMDISLGYTFTDTRYSASQNSQKPSFLSFDGEQYNFIHNAHQSHAGSFKLNYDLNERTALYTGASVTRTIYEEKDETDSTRYTFYVGGSYAFSENLNARIELGPNYSVPDTGSAALSPYAQISLNYAIGRSVFALSYNTSFEDNPESGDVVHKSSYGLSWQKNYERTKVNLGISYNTYETELGDDSQVSDSSSEQGNTFSPTVSIQHELTPRLSAFANYKGNIYENHKLGEHTHTGSYGLKYQLSEHSTISLSHRLAYTMPYEEDAYLNNQIRLDFSYNF